MKCPHCKKKIENVEMSSMYWILPNLVMTSLVVGGLGNWLPINMEEGYAANWGMVMSFIFIVLYFIYLELYNFNIVKGRFVLIKKDDS